MLEILHILLAGIASFRLLEIIMVDRLGEPLRKRFGKYYLFSCKRCMSVWTGAIATALYFIYPFLNWPLAFSWMYLFLPVLFDKQPNSIGGSSFMSTDPAELLKRQLGDLMFQLAVLTSRVAQVEEENAALKATAAKFVPAE
jgi:hypothetical protein